jgi:gamma-glutamylputrescine oxidase
VTTPYLDTWYRRTLTEETSYPALAGNLEAEICVIGGGLAGLSAAFELATAGRQVVLLEGRRIAWGASGRNGGFLTSGYSTGIDDIERMVGSDAAEALYRMSMEGTEIVRQRLAEWQIADSHASAGLIYATRYDSGDTLKAHCAHENARFGKQLVFLDRAELQQKLASDRYFQAIFDPAGSHFHPLNYAQGLAAAIQRAGGIIAEESQALRLEKRGAAHRVVTAQGSVTAQHVVFAGGGYTDHLLPQLKRAYLPIATYVLLTEKLGTLVDGLIRTEAAIADSRRAGDYYRRVDGDRILWGGRITTRRRDPADIAAILRRQMVGTYPALRDAKVELAWSGLMSYARHLMPQIGRLEEGLWYCTAFGGHGMNTTAIGGRVIAEAILGTSDRYRRFAPFGLNWNGGLIGTAAVQATYWYLQTMDWWRERG